MKRIFVLLSLGILIGCTCLSQIPPVTGYVDGNCEVPVPDFTVLVTVSDNCDPATLSQVPVAGTIVGQGVTQVVVSAVDLSGNSSSVNGSFIALDTIAPLITVDQTAFLYPTEDVFEMYRTFNCWVQNNKTIFLTVFNEFDTINNVYLPEYLENSIFNNTIYIPDTTDGYDCYATANLH